MEDKRQIEILEIIREKLIDGFSQTGICAIIDDLGLRNKITSIEYYAFKTLLMNHKPNAYYYTEFTKNKYWETINCTAFGYWWDRICDAPETRQIRIDYLTAVIEKIKTTNL